jgi:hypothetical protein
MDDRRNEFCFDACPHLYPLPSAFAFCSGAIASKHSEDGQERILPITVSGYSFAHPANPVARTSKQTENDSPSPSVFASLRRDYKFEPRRSSA